MIAVLLCNITASVYAFEIGGISYNITSEIDLTVEVIAQESGYRYSGVISIPSSVNYNGVRYDVKSIGRMAFAASSDLISITIPEGVNSIEQQAFYRCSGLTSIILPNSVKSIDYYAFDGCSNLTSIVLPQNLSAVYADAFANCSKLTEVYCYAESVPSTHSDAFLNSNIHNATLFVPANAIESYKTKSPWGSFGNIIVWDASIILVTDITLSQATASIVKGETLELTATVNPVNATDSSITWSSDNPDVATVDHIGKVTATGFGFATITAMANDGSDAIASCVVAVKVGVGDKFEKDGIYYKVISDTDLTVEVSYGDKEYSGIVEIPSTVTCNGSTYNVTSIGYRAFNDCDNLTNIKISNGINKIDSEAFFNCTNLLSIDIPESVESIGTKAFAQCYNLTSITIPKHVNEIGYQLFSRCYSLTSITIPKEVKSIGNDVFDGCTSLKELIFEDGEEILSIGYDYVNSSTKRGIFYDCPLEKIHLGRNLDYSSSPSPFTSKASLTNVTIGSNVTSIPRAAFYGSSNLKTVTIPDNVTSIENSAFYGCSSLSSITIPKNVTIIGDDVFNGCSSLASVFISGNIVSIGNNAFKDCCSFTSTIIPENVTSIGEGAFSGCSGELIVNCNIKSVSSYYKSPYYKSKFTNIIVGDNVTSIGDHAFNTSQELVSVTISGSVMSIGSFAFEDCSSLRSIVFENGDSLLTLGYNYKHHSSDGIGEGLFYDCPLESVYIGRNLSYEADSRYGYSPFYKSDRHPMISLGGGMTTISPYLCFKNTALTTFIIPDGITNIGISAFRGCSSLSSITISEGVSTIEYAAFFDCNSLTSIAIPNSITSIGGAAFSGCSNLISISIPNSVTNIGDNAFYGCSNLVDLEIPKGVKSLGNYSFSGCRKLKDIIIPEGVETIGAGTFSGCSELKSVTIPYTIAAIGEWAFNNCTSLTTIRCKIPAVRLFGINDNVFKGIPTGAVLYVSGNDKEVYCSTLGWMKFGWNNISRYNYLLSYSIDGEIYSSLFLDSGEAIPAVETPIKEGYTFGGWGEVPQTMPAKDITIIGTFIPNKYLATFKIEDEIIVTDSIECGAPIVLPKLPEMFEKEGCSFSGWRDCPATMPAEDIVITGSFTVNEYKLTYMVDGKELFSDSIVYGTELAAIVAPIKEGHTFSGWKELPNTMPAKDVVITGSFTANSYSVIYKVNGEVYRTETVIYGTELTAIDAPTKEGHTFSGWSELPNTMPAEDVVITGSFTINSYSVIYEVDGEVYRTETVAYGTELVAIESPAKEGHTFGGWSELPKTMPAEDVIVIGNFVVNTYKVHYYIEDELVHTEEVAYGEKIPEYIYVPTDGGEFLGWEGDVYEAMPAYDITYVGKMEYLDTAIKGIMLNGEDLMFYDLQGRRVLDVENMKGGLYIVNGRKVMIK